MSNVQILAIEFLTTKNPRNFIGIPGKKNSGNPYNLLSVQKLYQL